MSTGTMESYDQVGRKEDVSDIITTISPTKTPFQTMIGTESIHNILHQWQEDSLLAAQDQAAVEGATAPTASWQATVLRNNTTQIYTNTASVSGTADAVKTYGRDKELAYQLSLRSAELKRNLETTLVGLSAAAGAAVTGNDAAARHMAGYLAMLDASTTYYQDGGVGTANGSGSFSAPTTVLGGTLAESAVLAVAQACYVNGSEPNTLMVKPHDALVVAGFQTTSGTGRTKFIDNKDKQIVNVVTTYVSPFGELKVIINRFQFAGAALIFEPDMWKRLVLRNWFRQSLAKVGDSTQMQLVGEFSLKHRNFKASGAIVDQV